MSRSAFVRWQPRTSEPSTSLDELVGSRPSRHILTELDWQVLDALLRYNFMTAEQCHRWGEWSLRTVQYRLGQLYRYGLVDRGYWRANGRPGRPMTVYALSRRGFDLLRRNEHSLAIDWADDWRPKSETGAQKLSVAHELGRNDVCIAIAESARARGIPVLDWEGPREATQRFVTDAARHEWHRIEPDAVMIIANWQPLFIEYERSGRDTKFQRKIRSLRAYLVSQQWKTRYPREPWVVYAIPAGLGTQGVVGGSYGGMMIQAGMTGARRYVLLDEDAWTDGTWMAMMTDGTVADFWTIVTGDSDHSRYIAAHR